MILPVNDHQNPIIALLNGPDTRYKNILMNENIPIANNSCQNKNSFLQIHVRKFISHNLPLIFSYRSIKY